MGGYPGSAKNMINLFGITIEAPGLNAGHYFDELLISVAKKNSERDVLRQFLTPRISEIITQAKVESAATEVNDFRPQTVDFYLSQLKSTGVYEKMVLKVISSDHQFSSAKTAKDILDGRRPELSSTFPGDHKKAENLVVGSVNSAIGPSECREYLTRKTVKTKIQDIAKDLFYAVNHGLSAEQSTRFIGIIYDLDKIKTADFTNPIRIKENIIHSLQTNKPLNLIHIKCLRFTYPYGNRLQLIDHTSDCQVPTKLGTIHHPASEVGYFNRLNNIQSVFSNYGVTTNLHILINDQDLSDYFPNNTGDGIIPDVDLVNAKTDMDNYHHHLASIVDGSVKYFRQYLSDHQLLEKFDSYRLTTLNNLNRGLSVIPENLIESRVNYRYQSNTKIFSVNPGRQFARQRVYAQLASLQALSVLGRDDILVESAKGEEARLIGGYKTGALPVIFTKLFDHVS